MKKTSICLLLLLTIVGTVQAQVLRIITSPAIITAQVPGYSQVTTINTKTIAYTPSVLSVSITPILPSDTAGPP